jgi:hypothetical protein
MKFTKLSLVAALAMSSAFAGGDIAPVEPVVEAAPVVSESTITGNIKLWYGTNDAGTADLFNKNGAIGDAYFDLKYTRDILDGAVTLNAGIAGVSTLGLQSDLVSGTFVNHGPTVVNEVVWLNTFNATVHMGDTTAVLGRQELATPFFFSETWNIATNTFDAAVLVNSSLPDTTLVAAYVGQGNGTGGGQVVNLADENFGGGHTKFSNNESAYAFAIVNKSITNTTLQAWYYQIPSVANAYWLQADVALGDFSVGAQYAGATLNAAFNPSTSDEDTSAWAAQIAYASGALKAHVAYSQRDDNDGIDIANIATGHAAGAQSSLYTETYWNYGYVGQKDASTIAVGVGYDMGVAQLGAQYTDVRIGNNIANTGGGNTAGEVKEFALTASTKIGPVNADLAYVYADRNTLANVSSTDNTVLIMLSMPFSL